MQIVYEIPAIATHMTLLHAAAAFTVGLVIPVFIYEILFNNN